jgi:hypothetical protein
VGAQVLELRKRGIVLAAIADVLGISDSRTKKLLRELAA